MSAGLSLPSSKSDGSGLFFKLYFFEVVEMVFCIEHVSRWKASCVQLFPTIAEELRESLTLNVYILWSDRVLECMQQITPTIVCTGSSGLQAHVRAWGFWNTGILNTLVNWFHTFANVLCWKHEVQMNPFDTMMETSWASPWYGCAQTRVLNQLS